MAITATIGPKAINQLMDHIFHTLPPKGCSGNELQEFLDQALVLNSCTPHLFWQLTCVSSAAIQSTP